MERRDIVRSAVRSSVRSPIRTARSGITDFLSSLPKLLHIEAESPYVLKTGGAEAGYVDGAAFVKNQDGERLSYEGVGYAYLSGYNGNYLSTTTAVDYSTDFDIIWEGSPDWQTGSSLGRLAGRMLDGNNMSFRMALLGAGRLEFAIFPTGLGSSVVVHGPVTPVPFADFEFGRVRATFSSSTMTLYYSTDPYGTPDEDLIWVSLGSLVTIYPTMFLSTGNVNIGTDFDISTNLLKGQFKRAIFKTGGVPFIDIDIHRDADHLDTSFICGTGQTVSVIGSGPSPARIIKANGELKVTGFVQTTAVSQPTYLPYDGVGYAHMGVSSNRLEVSLPSPWTGYNTLYAEVEIIGSTILSNTDTYGLLSIMSNTFVEECFRMTLLSSNRVEFTIKNAAGTRLFVGVLNLTGLIISTDIIKLKLEVDEVNNTRTISYKINDGVWVVAVTGVYTIDGTFQYTSPKLFIGAVTGIVPSPILYFRSCLVKINNVDLVDINIERDATNNAASFVCGTGQTVSVVGAGNNPATIIKKARIRGDGVDDYLASYDGILDPTSPNYIGTKYTFTALASVNNLSQDNQYLFSIGAVVAASTGYGGLDLRYDTETGGSFLLALQTAGNANLCTLKSSFGLSSGELFTVSVVVDEDLQTVSLWKNGVLETDTTIEGSFYPPRTNNGTEPRKLRLMNRYTFQNGGYFVGDLFDFVITPKALTPTEVAKLHTQLING